MTPSDPANDGARPGDSARAFGIMFLAGALLTLMLGWAEGVRRDSTILHIPETRSFLLAGIVLIVIGLFFLVWSKRSRSAR